MLKIKKLTPRSWAGVGFGDKSATYGVEGRPEIRIIRASHGWTAYIGTKKLFGVTKSDLECQLT